MSDKSPSFTFFEFHFHDAFQLGPKTLPPFGGKADQSPVTEESDEPAESPDRGATAEPSGSSLAPKLVGLGVLAAAAFAVRKLLSGGPSGLDALDDIEELDDLGSGYEDGTAEDNGVAIEVTSGEETESGSNTGLLVAAVVAVFLLVVLAARKLLGGDIEEIEIPDELAEE